QLYPKEVQIDRPAFRNRFPLVTGSGHRARVKLIIHEQGTPFEGDDFSWTHVDGLLKSADIELSQCLFFVVILDRKQKPTLVCYGAGTELQQLFNFAEAVPQRLGLTVGEQFVGALNRNDALGVQDAVETARKSMLKRHPHAEVLLSIMVDEGRSVQEVLETMKKHGLTRILLTSTKA